MSSIRSALVIGGGVAGPATALALHRAGIDATIFEAAPAAADGVGNILTLASNGIDALAAIGAAGPALAAGFETPEIALISHTGKWLGASRTSSRRPGAVVSHTLRRPDLFRGLRDEAVARGIKIEYGRRLVGAEPTGSGVRAMFGDGSEATADVLIGCDGVHSTVRRLIDPTAPSPRYAGLLTTGGFARGVATDAPPGHYQMIFGRRAFFGHATAPDGEVWWFVNLPHRAEPRRGEVESVDSDTWRASMLDLYAGDAGPATALIEATPHFSPMTPIHTVPQLRQWHRGRMIVIGDAAHAPSPTSGQGASLAAEDAVLLALGLRDASTPEQALEEFVRARRARVERIIRMAARINQSKAPGPFARRLRDLVLPAILRRVAAREGHDEVLDHHVEWNSTAPMKQSR